MKTTLKEICDAGWEIGLEGCWCKVVSFKRKSTKCSGQVDLLMYDIRRECWNLRIIGRRNGEEVELVAGDFKTLDDFFLYHLNGTDVEL